MADEREAVILQDSRFFAPVDLERWKQRATLVPARDLAWGGGGVERGYHLGEFVVEQHLQRQG